MTRLYNNLLSTPLKKVKLLNRVFQQNILSMLCLVLIGFLSGNLFGTILGLFRELIIWDGFIIACLILVMEIISYFSYNSIQYTLNSSTRAKNKLKFFKKLNFFKIGLMIGFFVDAFKVGS